LPDFWGANAIWGATGNDRRGHIWLGITSNDEKTGSAHLYEFDPSTDLVVDRGNVVAELERLHLRRPGERQMKIHSRIVQMPDGYLYFSSMDESGEHEDGSKLPDWGGHLWRIGGTGRWEHLATTPEALIAVAGGGQFVYALGYFDHVLYQCNTRTKAIKSVRVGSVGGHISRNFFADDRGHVFVPRLTPASGGKGQRIEVSLVEFGADLRQIATFPLPDYLEGEPLASHGIVAIHPDGAGGWYFATGKGRLYRVQPATTGTSTLADLGWFRSSGPGYMATMFRDETSGMLYGIAIAPGTGPRRFQWIARDAAGKVTVSPLPIGDAALFPTTYGSMTRDTRGRFYAAGMREYKPVLLQITPQ
jgi:hypothetical protein